MAEEILSEQHELIEKIIRINRVSKVTKGMKRLSFSALVVVGNTNGKVGFAVGKAREVANAIRKGLSKAKKNQVNILIEGTTIPHKVIGAFGGARVLLKSASEGTGIIACGPVRAICEAAGIHDILTKSLKSNNPTNVIKATLEGLARLKE